MASPKKTLPVRLLFALSARKSPCASLIDILDRQGHEWHLPWFIQRHLCDALDRRYELPLPSRRLHD